MKAFSNILLIKLMDLNKYLLEYLLYHFTLFYY